jgi:hypothetical protein
MPIAGPLLLEACALLEQGDWEGAHSIVQQDEEDPLACWVHAVAHRIEGDLDNAAYWYRAAGRRADGLPEVASEVRAIRTQIETRSGSR